MKTCLIRIQYILLRICIILGYLTGFVSTCDKSKMELLFDVAWTLDSSESSPHIVTPMCVFGSQNAMTDGTSLKKCETPNSSRETCSHFGSGNFLHDWNRQKGTFYFTSFYNMSSWLVPVERMLLSRTNTLWKCLLALPKLKPNKQANK